MIYYYIITFILISHIRLNFQLNFYKDKKAY